MGRLIHLWFWLHFLFNGKSAITILFFSYISGIWKTFCKLLWRKAQLQRDHIDAGTSEPALQEHLTNRPFWVEGGASSVCTELQKFRMCGIDAHAPWGLDQWVSYEASFSLTTRQVICSGKLDRWHQLLTCTDFPDFLCRKHANMYAGRNTAMTKWVLTYIISWC